MRAVVFFQSIVFLLGRMRSIAAAKAMLMKTKDFTFANLLAVVPTHTILFWLFFCQSEEIR